MSASLLETTETFKSVGAAVSIFRHDCAEYAIFYAPNCLCVVGLADAAWFETIIGPSEIAASVKPAQADRPAQKIDWGAELWRRADLAVTKVNDCLGTPFRPECLTLYMNNKCNLRCIYCHTDALQKLIARLDLDVIAAAAAVVAKSCRKKESPFSVVFHGGGEPTLHRQRVENALTLVGKIALAYDIELFRYVATNGMMSEEKAVWLAQHFDLVGLSCDGPPDIQNCQRPDWNGGDTAHILERTARILREQGCQFNVRTTITRATLGRQVEIADYICQQFLPQKIIFEPVYLGGRNSAATGLGARHAGGFVTHFLKAREIAQRHGVPLTTSGSRLGEIHGPYCNVFRSVLNLTPGGIATACFKTTDAGQTAKKGVVIGAMNGETGRFEIDYARVQTLRRQLNTCPPRCVDCFNRYHCVRECPDLCPLDNEIHADDHANQSDNLPQPGFRCQVQKALTYATLRKTAESLWVEAIARNVTKNGGNTSDGNCRLIHGTTIL
jgi:sulfatase maturation enzyme AslB (radical SAM superfamily)